MSFEMEFGNFTPIDVPAGEILPHVVLTMPPPQAGEGSWLWGSACTVRAELRIEYTGPTRVFCRPAITGRGGFTGPTSSVGLGISRSAWYMPLDPGSVITLTLEDEVSFGSNPGSPAPPDGFEIKAYAEVKPWWSQFEHREHTTVSLLAVRADVVGYVEYS